VARLVRGRWILGSASIYLIYKVPTLFRLPHSRVRTEPLPSCFELANFNSMQMCFSVASGRMVPSSGP